MAGRPTRRRTCEALGWRIRGPAWLGFLSTWLVGIGEDPVVKDASDASFWAFAWPRSPRPRCFESRAPTLSVRLRARAIRDASRGCNPVDDAAAPVAHVDGSIWTGRERYRTGQAGQEGRARAGCDRSVIVEGYALDLPLRPFGDECRCPDSSAELSGHDGYPADGGVLVQDGDGR